LASHTMKQFGVTSADQGPAKRRSGVPILTNN
jgi:hypothetical protein